MAAAKPIPSALVCAPGERGREAQRRARLSTSAALGRLTPTTLTTRAHAHSLHTPRARRMHRLTQRAQKLPPFFLSHLDLRLRQRGAPHQALDLGVQGGRLGRVRGWVRGGHGCGYLGQVQRRARRGGGWRHGLWVGDKGRAAKRRSAALCVSLLARVRDRLLHAGTRRAGECGRETRL